MAGTVAVRYSLRAEDPPPLKLFFDPAETEKSSLRKVADFRLGHRAQERFDVGLGG